MINFINNEKLKNIGGAIILATMIGVTSISLTGCGSNDNETVLEEIEEDRKDYGVVIDNDIACICEITNDSYGSGGRFYYSKDDNKELFLSHSMTHFLKDYTLEEAEEYARIYLSENGQIKYYNVEGKDNPKTLTKMKSNSK